MEENIKVRIASVRIVANFGIQVLHLPPFSDAPRYLTQISPESDKRVSM